MTPADDFLTDIGVALDPTAKPPAPKRSQASNPALDSYQAQFGAAEQKYGLPAGILRAVAAQESSGDINAKSPKGALGLMQLLPDPKTGLGPHGADPHDPGASIDAAGHYLHDALAKYNNDVPTALKSYHGGFDQSKWGPLTNAYAPAVMARMGTPAQGQDGFLNDLGVTLDGASAATSPAGNPTAGPAIASAPPTPSAAKPIVPGPRTLTVDQIAHGSAFAPGSDIQLPGGAIATVAGVQTLKPGQDPGPGYTKVQRGGQTLYIQTQPSDRTQDFPSPVQPKTEADLSAMVHNALISNADRAQAQKGGFEGGFNALLHGGGQGLRDVGASLDPVAQWMASTPVGSAVDKAGSYIGLPSADEAHANNVTARDQFNQLYGNNSPAQFGRFAGNVAASLPMEEFAAARLAPAAEAMGATGRFLAGTAGQVGDNAIIRAASAGTNQALRGATTAALTSGSSDAPVLDQMRDGAALGGTLGGAGSAAFSAGRRVLGSALQSPEAAALAQRAGDFGINLRAGQISGNRFLNTVDSVLNDMPLSGYAANSAKQRDAFARAVAGTFGENGSTLTPAVMSQARSRIGSVFDDVANKTTITGRDQLVNDLGAVAHEASGVLPEHDLSPILSQVERIASSFDSSGKMSGETYQALTRKGTPLDRLMQSADPNMRHYAGQVRDALDQALQNSAAPEDLARLQQARLQWKNLKTVEGLAAKASPDGDISPALLLNAVKKSYGDFAYSGGGDIGDLAKIGQRFLKEPPNSGTAPRSMIHNMLTAGGLVGGGAGAADLLMHDPGLAMKLAGLGFAGGVGTLGITRTAGALLDNPLTRGALLSGARSAPDELGPLVNYVPSAAVIGSNRLVDPNAIPQRAAVRP